MRLGALRMETAKRPLVSAARYRELEILTMQIMLQLPHDNIGECLIVYDIGRNILRRWVENERLAEHAPGIPLMATSDGNIIHLKPGE